MQKFNLTMRGSSCYQLSLPFSNPGTPLDPETDIPIRGRGNRRLFLEDEQPFDCKKPLSALTLPLQRTSSAAPTHYPFFIHLLPLHLILRARNQQQPQGLETTSSQSQMKLVCPRLIHEECAIAGVEAAVPSCSNFASAAVTQAIP